MFEPCLKHKCLLILFELKLSWAMFSFDQTSQLAIIQQKYLKPIHILEIFFKADYVKFYVLRI